MYENKTEKIVNELLNDNNITFSYIEADNSEENGIKKFTCTIQINEDILPDVEMRCKEAPGLKEALTYIVDDALPYSNANSAKELLEDLYGDKDIER